MVVFMLGAFAATFSTVFNYFDGWPRIVGACCRNLFRGTAELDGIDPTSLASLTAGTVAATDGVAQIVGEESFTNLFHEGRSHSLHITVVADQVILVVLFDQRSSLGLVRLRVEQRVLELGAIVKDLLAASEPAAQVNSTDAASMAQITDADIDALFGGK